MTKQLSETDIPTMRLLQLADEHHATEVNPEHSLFEHLTNADHLGSTLLRNVVNPTHASQERSKIVARAMTVVRIARRQSLDLLGAADEVLRTADPAADTAAILKNSADLGRTFGKVSGLPKRRTRHNWLKQSNDRIILRDITVAPQHYLAYDDEHEQITFSEQGRELLRPHISKITGCPAMARTVSGPGEQPINLFLFAWDNFTDEYLATRPAASVNSQSSLL